MDLDRVTFRDICDGGTQNRIVKTLRLLPEEEQLRRILRWVDTIEPPGAPLRVVPRLRLSKESYKAILRHGFAVADRGYINDYLFAAAPGIGRSGILSILEEAALANENREALEGAFYSIRAYLGQSETHLRRLEQIQRQHKINDPG